jgi:hypothetical protein
MRNSRRIVDGGEPGKGKVATSLSEVARVKEGRGDECYEQMDNLEK